MDKNIPYRIFIILVSVLLLVVIYHCKNPERESEYYRPIPLATHTNGNRFVGSETCIECHADIYFSHSETAHSKTSAIADTNNVLGSFDPGSNVLDLEYAKFTVLKNGDTLYQTTEYKNRNKKDPPKSLDIVIGSGVRGQSYATWNKDALFQLQTSYHTPTDNWVNSPGYPDYVDEDRPIRGACLKCHATFATLKETSRQGNEYDPQSLILGIACERCHQPSEKHVVYHRKHPEAQPGKFILSLDSLGRQKRLDVCAQCHSGPRDLLVKGNPFSFLAGEVLNDYARNSNQAIQKTKVDVHGNQYGLLTQSECFKKSPEMDCATCHDPHSDQRGNTSHFNQKCMECHSTDFVTCAEETTKMAERDDNCIACHMPISPSEIMKVQLRPEDSVETSFQIRSHLIAIYKNKEGFSF